MTKLILISTLLLSGCTVDLADTTVTEHTLKDGTKCAVTQYGGITCDWRNNI